MTPRDQATNAPLREQRDASPEVVACHACGAVHRIPPLAGGTKAECTRCGTVLYRRIRNSVDRALALQLAALILFVVANAFPIMTLSIEGRSQTATILAGAEALRSSGLWPLALVVLAAGTVMPLLKILCSLYVLLPLRLGARAPGLAHVFRVMEIVGPWAMNEVYLLGLIVAYVKLSDIAEIQLGVSIVAFVGLILTMVAADGVLEPHQVWVRLAPQAGASVLEPEPGSSLVSCHGCEQLVRVPQRAGNASCPRCAASLHARKTDSLSRCTALMITAALLYVPANMLPVMTVVYFGSGEPDTILSGVFTLLQAGMWPIAALVFFASVLVPVLKLLGLAYLVITVRLRRMAGRRERTRLFRIIEGIGRWSMVDVFMIAILTALVNLGAIASVQPNLGAVAFAGVVISTMLASMAFDPRLIWDDVDERDGDERPARA